MQENNTSGVSMSNFCVCLMSLDRHLLQLSIHKGAEIRCYAIASSAASNFNNDKCALLWAAHEVFKTNDSNLTQAIVLNLTNLGKNWQSFQTKWAHRPEH